MFKKISIMQTVLILILFAGVGLFLIYQKDYTISPGKISEAIPSKNYKVTAIHTGGSYVQAISGLKVGMAALGFVENSNITYDIRDLEGDTAKIPDMIKELESLGPDVLYTVSTPVTTKVMQGLEGNIPIVFNLVGDPVYSQFVRSYVQPDTNLTGCTNLSAELSGKRMEIFKEAFPQIKKAVTFYNPDNSFSVISIEISRRAAKMLGISFSEINVKSADELRAGLESIKPGNYDGFYITPDALVVSNIEMVVEKSKLLKIPTVAHEETLAEKGVSITYGANFFNLGVQCSRVLARVLEGESPRSVPVEIPQKFDIVVNKKALEQIGANISKDVLLRSDRIIK